MSNDEYEIDSMYPKPGKRISNRLGVVERDSDGELWLTHNKIIIKGSANDTEEDIQ